ncbi:MAG: hypothetical protein EYC62_08980 [Alphaproteobacteria bacterium]|nr:MAG: hypothetical protein EYC62_08980 [Alphaproteobacteria bacterium]
MNFEINGFLLFGLLLLAGVVGGDIARKSKRIPRIIGYILFGFLIGPGALGLLNDASIKDAQIFLDIALGLILYQIGAYLNISELSHNPRLIFSSFIESLFTFCIVAVGLYYSKFSLLLSFLFGAIAISSSPAVILATVREYGVKGVFSKRILNLVALNNMFSFLFFAMVMPFVHWQNEQSLHKIITYTPIMLLGSAGIGWVLASFKERISFFVAMNKHNQVSLLLAFTGLGLGLAKMLDLSYMLTMLSMGLFCFNSPIPHKDAATPLDEPGDISELSIMILFVIAGVKLNFSNLYELLGFSLLFICLRSASKILGLFIVRPDKDLDKKHTLLLGISLTPMAGLAMGLSLMLNNLYPELMNAYIPYIFAVIALLELLGPMATEYSLRKSGEVDNQIRISH